MMSGEGSRRFDNLKVPSWQGGFVGAVTYGKRQPSLRNPDPLGKRRSPSTRKSLNIEPRITGM